MSDAKPLTDQSGRPVGMVVTPKGARIEVLGEALPPAQRGASIHVDPKGGGRPHGDFPVKHPNSGPTPKQKTPAPKTITPIDNGTLGRVYTMGLPAPEQIDAEPTEPPPPGYLERSGEVLKGYGEGLVELPVEATKMAAEGWKNIVTEPIETAEALAWGAGELGGMALDGWRQIVSDPGQAFDAFVWAGKEALTKANEILGGDSREAGKLVGEVVSVVVPVAAAKAKPRPAQLWQLQRTDLLQELRANPYLSVTEHGNGDVLIQIRSAGAYRRGKAVFSEEQGKVLADIAAAIRSRDALRVKLIGHTDTAGSAEGNLRLSTERAEAVRELFVSTGVDAARIEVVGAGSAEPIAPNTSAEGRAVNRRVDVLIVPAL